MEKRNSMGENFEKLECWQACNDLKKYLKEQVLLVLPKTERYELYSQILRASRSATANIAEGWGRYHYKENIKFLLNARGSVAEILDHSLEVRGNTFQRKSFNKSASRPILAFG